MGVWGTGLYAGDFALDVKGMISAVAKLPLEAEQLVDALCRATPEATSAGADQIAFWLVMADQFEKRGIFSPRVRSIALGFIESGADAAMMQELGMQAGDLRKRAANLADLRARLLAQPETSRPRKTLRAPEPYVFETGGIYAYPTKQGHPINPYATAKQFNRAAWVPDGFGLLLVLGRGRAFDYLTWYHGATSLEAFAVLPDQTQLLNNVRWRAPPVYGNCPVKHFQKLEMREIGVCPIDPARCAHFFPHLVSGHAYAIQDICISNKLHLARREARAWARGADGKMTPIIYPSPPVLAELTLQG